jgi:hypothetical protein
MALRDELSADIIRINLETQMDKLILTSYDPPNYLLDILERRASIDDSELNTFGTINEKDFIDDLVLGLFKLAEEKLEEKFGVVLGEDLDYLSPPDYMDKVEILYEFFFIRHYDNLITFILHEILARKTLYYKRFKDEVDAASKANTGDVYVRYAKEKYKDMDIVTILYKLKDLINEIKESNYSMLESIEKIINQELYEECNYNIQKMFIGNYGKDASFEDDSKAYSLFMKPLDNYTVFDRLMNDVKLRLLELFNRIDE